MSYKEEPKTGQRWKHPLFGIGTVTITPGGHIRVDFESGTVGTWRAARDFHKDDLVRERLGQEVPRDPAGDLRSDMQVALDEYQEAMRAQAGKIAECVLVLSEERALFKAAAEKLWLLLDDIDTLDDSCKESNKLFRDSVRECQKKRFNIATSEDGHTLTWVVKP